jgi:hypothetical protein
VWDSTGIEAARSRHFYGHTTYTLTRAVASLCNLHERVPSAAQRTRIPTDFADIICVKAHNILSMWVSRQWP